MLSMEATWSRKTMASSCSLFSKAERLSYTDHSHSLVMANASTGQACTHRLQNSRLLVNARISRGISQSFPRGIMPRRIARTAACVRS